MRWLLVCLGLILVSPIAASAIEGPAEVVFPSRWGVVSFSHQAHLTRVGACVTCHHQGTEEPRCGSCHGVLPATPLRKDVLHKQCKDCHRDRRGPTDCAGCHDPEQVDDSVYSD